MLDVAIVGGGPAALSAALYLARAGRSVKAFETANFGGTLPLIAQIENYPGFVGEGQALAQQMLQQARSAGAEIVYGECTDISHQSNHFRLTIDDESVEARVVLIASGSAPKTLSFTPAIPVSYCALCDGALAKGKNVAVVGGANSAVQEAIYLAHLASQVTIITHSKLKANPSLIAQLSKLDNINLLESTEPTPELINQYDYCFVYIGRAPATSFLQNLVQANPIILDQSGYIVTSGDAEYPHQTTISGLFAAGDVRQGATKQVVAAAADGAMAAIEISRLF